ncbi:hypothetical protein ODY53_06860 [Aeromonas veronii]|uniref:hypothetical protein n=1 Tax=Aeromonas veronii TaxID=654 RepID=UPI0022480AA3|nr:hypothetical protein [Aeromonas veronii]MCX0422091.1 hypothetical protein [Aeromonas veronii]
MAKKPNAGNRAPRATSKNVTWAQAFRDIVVSAMSRGQLIPLGVFIVVLSAVYKMPEEKVYDFAIYFVNGLSNHSLTGYVIAVITCILWGGHVKTIRRSFSDEARRIGLEKTKLQSHLSPIPYPLRLK